MRKYRILTMLMLVLAIMGVVSGASALTDRFDPEAPYFEVISGDRFPLKSTNVSGKISGIIGYVTITQTYKNEGTTPIEARYIFPGSTRSAVHNATLAIGDEKIIATIKTREEAEKVYQSAVSIGKTASLLSQERPNVFQQRIGNILPGETVEVSLTYSEELVLRNGLYHFVVPAVVGPRYTGEDSSSSVLSTIPYFQGGETSEYPVTIDISIESGSVLSGVSSSSYQPEIVQDGVKSRVLLKTQNFNKDFDLSYRLQSNDLKSSLIIHEDIKENFFLLSIQPPKDLTEDKIIPREYQFILDTSGSMSGYPIETAKKLLKTLLIKLTKEDSFNIRFFAGGSSTAFSSSQSATESNISFALNMIDSVDSGGGTELLSALQATFQDIKSNYSKARSIIIITDGYISVEKEAFSLVREHLNEANLFSFGVGSSINRFLIDGLAHVGHGSPFVVSSEEEVDPVVNEFVDLLRSPVLHNIKLRFDGFEAYAVEPKSIPTVFKNQPLYVYGKWRGEPRGGVAISGTSTKGEFHEYLPLQSVSSRNNPALRFLWARKRLQLLDDYQLIGVDQQKTATELALEYSLLSQYTSFVAVSERIRTEQAEGNTETIETIIQPLPLPAGMMTGTGYAAHAVYSDSRIAESADVALTLLNGSLGALLMIVSGMATIMLAAFGTKKNRRIRWVFASISGLIAVGFFVVRSLISTWFNDTSLN
jgi:Ca-activated chloride channel family protein